MTRDEKIKLVCEVVAYNDWLAKRDVPAYHIARELLAGMGEELQTVRCHCDPNQIGYTYTLSGMQCTLCGLIRH